MPELLLDDDEIKEIYDANRNALIYYPDELSKKNLIRYTQTVAILEKLFGIEYFTKDSN